MGKRDQQQDTVVDQLKLIQEVQDRSVANIEKGRIAYLREAKRVSLTVSPRVDSRLNRWMKEISSRLIFYRKEHTLMFNIFATIMVILTMALGAGGVTVAAAQSSQPDQPLYDVKLWTEEMRIALTSDPEVQYQLEYDFTARRFEEIKSLLDSKKGISEEMMSRYQNQIDQALQYALKLNGDSAVKALQKLEISLQKHNEVLSQYQGQGSLGTNPILEQTRLMIQDRLHLFEEGLTPDQIRIRLQERDQIQDQTQSATPEIIVTQGLQETQGLQGTVDKNPWTTGTPTPGSGYGPGPGPDESCTCTPASGDGSGGLVTPPVHHEEPTNNGNHH